MVAILDDTPLVDAAGLPLARAISALVHCAGAYAPAPGRGIRIRTTADSADLHYCPAERRLTIAVRGTDSASQWISNLDTHKIAIAGAGPRKPCLVHRGFYRAALPLSELIFRAASEITDRELPRSIVWTGHSRGAALAALCAMRIPFPGMPFVSAYYFGMPRVGDRAWASNYDADLPDTWRLVLRGDIVSRTPRPWMGFWHVGKFLYIDRRNRRYSAATGYPRLFWDRLFALVNDIGRPGLATVRAHGVDEYLIALTKDTP